MNPIKSIKEWCQKGGGQPTLIKGFRKNSTEFGWGAINLLQRLGNGGDMYNSKTRPRV